MACLLKNDPTSPSTQLCLSPYGVEAQGNRVLKARAILSRVECSGPEAKRACHGQGESRRNAGGGPNQ